MKMCGDKRVLIAFSDASAMAGQIAEISNRSNRILRIGIVAPNGAQALDFMGPIDAFHEANRSSKSASRYEVDLIGVRAGPIVSSSGTRLLPDKVIGSDLNLYDTILVAGSLDYQTTVCEQGLVDWLATAAPLARRVGSISNGAFVLAAGWFARRPPCGDPLAGCQAAVGHVSEDPRRTGLPLCPRRSRLHRGGCDGRKSIFACTSSKAIADTRLRWTLPG